MNALAAVAENDDPVAAARAAGLRYVSDAMPGIRRRRSGRGFAYTGPEGEPVRDPEVLSRIKRLAVPPAWTDVWISPAPNGHIQATGRDARRRKQYRYHDSWREVRDETKYERLLPFGEALPRIRRRVNADLSRPGLPKEKVLAAVVRLMDRTLIRVGNQEYAKENESFGATTLQEDHVEVRGESVEFRFRGKSGKDHAVRLRDRRLARIVEHLLDLPGQELFRYVGDDGEPHPIESADVNDYLREAAGADFTAKDFRTWAGTVLGLHALRMREEPGSDRHARREVKEAIKWVAGFLGNTPTVCERCYVHPAVVDAYREQRLERVPHRRVEAMMNDSEEGLRPEERELLRFLRRSAR